MSMKNPLTPAGIEPATFRIVGQHLNHCATVVPLCFYNPTVIALVQADLPFQRAVSTKFKYTTNEMVRVPVYHRIL